MFYLIAPHQSSQCSTVKNNIKKFPVLTKLRTTFGSCCWFEWWFCVWVVKVSFDDFSFLTRNAHASFLMVNEFFLVFFPVAKSSHLKCMKLGHIDTKSEIQINIQTVDSRQLWDYIQVSHKSQSIPKPSIVRYWKIHFNKFTSLRVLSHIFFLSCPLLLSLREWIQHKHADVIAETLQCVCGRKTLLVVSD